MTEKRFTIKEFSTLDAMSSLDVICDNGIELPSSTACDLLNELSDENEQLKSKLEESKKAHSNCDKLWWELHDEKEQLKKENEQLKQQLIEKERMLDVRDKIIKDVMKAVNGDVE